MFISKTRSQAQRKISLGSLKKNCPVKPNTGKCLKGLNHHFLVGKEQTIYFLQNSTMWNKRPSICSPQQAEQSTFSLPGTLQVRGTCLVLFHKHLPGLTALHVALEYSGKAPYHHWDTILASERRLISNVLKPSEVYSWTIKASELTEADSPKHCQMGASIFDLFTRGQDKASSEEGYGVCQLRIQSPCLLQCIKEGTPRSLN